MRPHLESCLVKTRNRRLESELGPAVEARMKILEELYDAYLDRECRPSERYYCPPVSAFRPKPDFMKVIEADKDAIITAKDFEPITSNLGRHLVDYQHEKKEHLKTLVPEDRLGNNFEYPCDLARHVFRRAHLNPEKYWGAPVTITVDQVENQVLVGWPMIGTHWYPESDKLEVRPGVNLNIPARFVYNGSLSRISSQLISLAGLDPATATVQEMDAKNPRFVHTEYDTAIGYPVLTWRAAVRPASSRMVHQILTILCLRSSLASLTR